MKSKKGFILIGTMICVLLLVGTVLTQKGNIRAEVGTKSNETKEEIEKRKEKKVDESILAVTMEQKIEFEDVKDEAVFNIENLPENNYDIKVEIKDEKDEIIYISGKIGPGMIIRKDKLNKEIEKGSHFCTATFKAINESGKEVREASAHIEIEIKK